MAFFEAKVDELDIGNLDLIGDHCERGWRENRRRLVFEAKDGTRIFADASQEAVDMLCMVWAALEYGGDGDDDEQTLADLRRVMASRQARIAALYAANPAQVA